MARVPRRVSPAAWGVIMLGVVSLLASGEARAQFGLAVAGVGPINRSMGGASTAAPLDAAGALFWNPATIAALGRSEMIFGTELLIPRTTLTSRVAPNTFGPGLPAQPLSGTTGGNNGVFPLPTFGLVYQPDDTRLTYGLGFFELGGFGVNYPSSKTNPILNPQGPFGRGVGALFTQYQAFQIAPTVAVKVTDYLTLGAAVNLDLGSLQVSPALFTNPGLVTTPLGPSPVYSTATNGRYRWGGGFQVGVYYDTWGDWHFGAALKSPQWFESYTYNAVNSQGQPFAPKFDLNFPMIASVGASYTGFDRFLVASDLRFLDYRNTNGFQHTGFDAQGALRGLGWQNVVALALGAQYRVSDTVSLRGGYTFSMNPVGNSVTAFNIAAPTIIQNTLSLGASYDVTKNLKISFAYVHFFQNSVTGPIVQPFVGPVPGSSVRSATTADSVILGAGVVF